LAVSTGAINSAITPILIKHYKNENKVGLSELASSIFNSIFILFLIFGFVQYFFAEQILQLILPGFSDVELVSVIVFFKIQAFLSIITILTSLLLALHYTYKNFYRTIIYPIIGQIAQIVFVWIYHKDFGIYALVYGLVISQSLSFFLFAIPFIKMYKVKIIYSVELKNANRKILPLIISSSFSKSNMLVDRFFASTLSAGSITLLQYGEKIIRIISSFINNGISLVSLRKFSIEQDNEEEFQRLFYLIYKTMIFIVVPVTFILIFFLKDALNIIVLSNKISNEDVEKIYWVTVAFIGIFIGGSLNSTITNAFYAKGLTKIVASINVVLQIFGIGLKIGMFYLIGFWGLPIAISITSIIGVIVLFILYNVHIYKYEVKVLLGYLTKLIIISALAVLIPKYISDLTSNLWIVRLCIDSILFISIFTVLTLRFEKDISKSIYDKIRVKLR